ncbi:hypothetical protein OGATHE_003869 [Ogataea polymorpha]|uniref:Uncharacterized protein n=1 Tax=Ogataea polymorpha TaxID=460523 RepID=A0A9P8P5G1_9ASCO|nr:hypothetical protein OGATHE_003869 [Ogataea polymorpha]
MTRLSVDLERVARPITPDWQHVDAVNVLDVGSEVRGVRDLVLKPDSTAVIANELRGHHRVVLCVQKVDVHGSFRDCEHQVCTVCHVGVVDDRGPNLHRVREIVVLTRALLVLAVRVHGDSVRDGVAEIKVKVSEDWEMRVVARRIGHVSHQRIDPVLDAAGPRPAQVGVHERTQRGRVDVVAIVEVVVVVERVSVVDRRVAVGHAARRADSTPVGLVAQRVLLAVAAEPLDGLLQRRQQRRRLVGIFQSVYEYTSALYSSAAAALMADNSESEYDGDEKPEMALQGSLPMLVVSVSDISNLLERYAVMTPWTVSSSVAEVLEPEVVEVNESLWCGMAYMMVVPLLEEPEVAYSNAYVAVEPDTDALNVTEVGHLPEVGELERNVGVEIAGAQTQRDVARRGVEVRCSTFLVGFTVHPLAGSLVGHGQPLIVGLRGVPQGVRVSVNIGGLVAEGQITPKVVCLDGTILCHPAGHRHRRGFLRKQRDGLGSGDGREDVTRGFTRSWILAGTHRGRGDLHVANILE